MGFTSACFAFAVGFLFITPVPLPYVWNVMEQLFPSKDPSASSGFAATGVLPGWPDCHYCHRSGLTGAGSTLTLHHFCSMATQTEKLSPVPLSLPLTLTLLAFSWTFCLTEGLALAHSAPSHGRQYTESTASNNLPPPCPTHPHYENPDQPL